MKKIFYVSILSLFLAGTTLLMNSCVRPDLSDCSSIRLTVRTLTDATRSVGDTYNIENVTVYVFDNQNRFITAFESGAYSGSGLVFTTELNLDPGTYHFVVWTNQGDTYTTTHSVEQCHQDKPSLSDLTLYMNCPSNKTLTTDIQDLHYGILTNAVVTANTDHEFTVVISPNTYRINFSVEGLTENTDRYAFSVRDDNSHYMFNNSIVSGKDTFNHLRMTSFADNKLTASMKTLLLTESRSPLFELSNNTTGKSLFSADLVALIKKAYTAWGQTVDFDNIYEYDIIITFRGNLGLIISVNGWVYMINDTEL